ncbi:MAG: hypothetical protein HOV81_20335 [Kofleriaceae bacterium]|nr:hypothetical protein [Kofleriaceae bacterium]
MKRSCLLFAVLTTQLGACSLVSGKFSSGSTPAPTSTAPAETSTPSSKPASAAASIDRSKLPAALADKIDRLTSDPTSANQRATYYRILDESADLFAKNWDAYQARLAVVSPVVEKAAKLRAANKLAEARALIETVITPVTRDPSSGRIKLARQTVEPIDAELPAVYELIAIARAQNDMLRVVEASADIYLRRKVEPARDRELTIWLAATQYDLIQGLGVLGGKDVDDLAKILGDAHSAKQAGAEAVMNYLGAIEDLGLKRVLSDFEAKLAPETWVMMTWRDRTSSAKVQNNKLTSSKKLTWQIPYDCVVTNRIESINPVTGFVRYVEKCKYRTESRLVTIEATLAGALPAWASSKGDKIIARSKHGGPNWVLDQFAVPDLRFVDDVTVYPFRSPY